MHELHRVITPAWPPGGHYSQGITTGGLVFVAGQTAGTPGTPELAALDVRQQTTECIRRIGAIVAEAGGTLADVVKTTCFLAEMGAFADFNEAYAEAFGATAPTRSTFQVGAFPDGLLVEIEAIAVISPDAARARD